MRYLKNARAWGYSLVYFADGARIMSAKGPQKHPLYAVKCIVRDRIFAVWFGPSICSDKIAGGVITERFAQALSVGRRETFGSFICFSMIFRMSAALAGFLGRLWSQITNPSFFTRTD